MPIEEQGGYCPTCAKTVLARRAGTNHLVHAILTVFTCLLWGAVWMIVAGSVGPYRCPNCGGLVTLT